MQQLRRDQRCPQGRCEKNMWKGRTNVKAKRMVRECYQDEDIALCVLLDQGLALSPPYSWPSIKRTPVSFLLWFCVSLAHPLRPPDLCHFQPICRVLTWEACIPWGDSLLFVMLSTLLSSQVFYQYPDSTVLSRLQPILKNRSVFSLC